VLFNSKLKEWLTSYVYKTLPVCFPAFCINLLLEALECLQYCRFKVRVRKAMFRFANLDFPQTSQRFCWMSFDGKQRQTATEGDFAAASSKEKVGILSEV